MGVKVKNPEYVKWVESGAKRDYERYGNWGVGGGSGAPPEYIEINDAAELNKVVDNPYYQPGEGDNQAGGIYGKKKATIGEIINKDAYDTQMLSPENVGPGYRQSGMNSASRKAERALKNQQGMEAFKNNLEGMSFEEKFREWEKFAKQGRAFADHGGISQWQAKATYLINSLYNEPNGHALMKEIEENMGFKDIRSHAFLDKRWTEEDYAKFDAYKTQFEWDKALDPDYLSGKARGMMNNAFDPASYRPGAATGRDSYARIDGGGAEPVSVGRNEKGMSRRGEAIGIDDGTTPGATFGVPAKFQEVAGKYKPAAPVGMQGKMGAGFGKRGGGRERMQERQASREFGSGRRGSAGRQMGGRPGQMGGRPNQMGRDMSRGVSPSDRQMGGKAIAQGGLGGGQREFQKSRGLNAMGRMAPDQKVQYGQRQKSGLGVSQNSSPLTGGGLLSGGYKPESY